MTTEAVTPMRVELGASVGGIGSFGKTMFSARDH